MLDSGAALQHRASFSRSVTQLMATKVKAAAAAGKQWRNITALVKEMTMKDVLGEEMSFHLSWEFFINQCKEHEGNAEAQRAGIQRGRNRKAT